MADTYIDYDETRIYGDYAIEQIARHVLGRLREFDPALTLTAAALRAATDAVEQHLHAARAQDPALHALMAARAAPMRAAKDALRRFAHHLDAHRAGEVERDRFFVEDPEALSARGPVRLLAALDHVLGTLDERAATVREATYWRAELSGVRADLESAVRDERSLRGAQVSSPELVAAREQWLAVYEAAKSVVSATLTLAGAAMPLDEVFDDLAATHRAEGALDDVTPTEAA